MKRILGVVLVLAVAAMPLGEAPRVAAADEVAINAAVERGVEALKKMQTGTGQWNFMGGNMGEKDIGCTAMVALALLEADVPPTDPVISNAHAVISRAAPKIGEVYALGAAIMFLDKYAEKRGGGAATALIGGMANKLLREQNPDGGWSYGGNMGSGFPDNSNTQFAVLGLWVARKQNMNVEKALLLAEKRFRKQQDKNGGWSYGFVNSPTGDPATPTMTCAGLLGLFLGFGASRERVANIRAGGDGGGAGAPPVVDLKDIRTDEQVQKAMGFLQQYVGGSLQNVAHWLYFLWSLERVCVTYEFKDVNGVDWYDWGSRILLRYQHKDGYWSADHGAAVDTAFALLFLKKSNLVGKIAQIRSGSGTKPGAGGPPTKGGTGSVAKNEPADAGEKLAQDLIKASAAKQAQLIEEYKTTRGADYTNALSRAIPKLGSGAQEVARIALAERLGRFNVDALRDYLADSDRELRFAAAMAAGRKGKDELSPELIKLLKDKDRAIADAAYDSLKSVSGKSLDKDPAAWEAWWKSKGSK